MEYLEGETLRATIQRRGALPIPECTEIIQQAARGLGAAHRLGIIHRDLKPDNIFLTRGEEGELAVKVVDFGIAKLRESATHTVTGTVLGTPQYMSFEQASGMRSEELDARSDLYSLGIITYEMLTGRLPFHSDTPLGYLRRHLTEEPPPFRVVKPDLPASDEIEKVVWKALAKDREQRYGSVREFAQELAQATQAIVDGFGAALPTTGRVVPSSPASSPELASTGRWGGGSVEPPVRTPLLPSQRVQPIVQPPQSSQPQSSTGTSSGPPGKANGFPKKGTMEQGYKPCPHCAEDIRIDAKVCKHCGRKIPQPTPAWRWALYGILGAAALGLFFFNLGRRPEADRQNQKLVEEMAKMRAPGVPENKQGIAQSQSEPKPEPVLPPAPPAPTPVTQVLAKGNFVIQPSSYSMVPFTVPQGATQVKVRGFFRAFGGAGNDVQVVIASASEFDNWINGHQIQAFYATRKVTTGEINIDNLPPGDYVLGFSNKFSAFTRKQVTALVTLSYIP
jgi:hypothetical protein